jgi:hypothetical protein
MAPQNRGGQKLKKNKPPNSQTLTKKNLCCFIVIKVQIWFVELRVAIQ